MRSRIIAGIIMPLALVLTLVLLGCSARIPISPESSPVDNGPAIVKLPRSMIDSAVEQSRDKTTWGISLAKVNTRYVTGVQVDAAIVLHNGDDAERLVTISYRPTYAPTVDANTRTIYDPSPVRASGWVTIDITTIRMSKMDTKIIPIHLLVPADQQDLPSHWEFGVAASGAAVMQYQYTIDVTTVDTITNTEGITVPDTTLELHLPYPLLGNQLSSILAVASNIAEAPQATEYNPVTGILILSNLKTSSERMISIIYEYTNPIVIDYNQRWLIDMVQ